MQLLKTNDNQIFQNPDGKIMQRYTLDSIVYSGDYVSIFQGHQNQSRQRFVFYITGKLKKDFHRFLSQFSTLSRLKIYRLSNYDIIQEAFFQTNLNDYLNSIFHSAYLDEQKVVEIFLSLFKYLREFEGREFIYANISLNSIVYEKGVWKFDFAACILDLYKFNRVFYPFKEINERAEVYALGVVVFTCLFGFYPFTNKTPDIFKMKNYLEYLNEKNPEQCTKIITFLSSKLRLSVEAIDILQRSLSITRQMSLNEFMTHPFFNNTRSYPIQYTDLNANIEIKILNGLQPKEVSKVLVAMEKNKSQLVPIRRQNLLANSHVRTLDNVVDFLKSDAHLSRFQINDSFKVLEPLYYNEHYTEKEMKSPPLLKLKYFNREISDLDDEYPCRQLIKYIDESRYNYGHDPERQALLLRYGFPYSVAFELIKVQHKQPHQIQQKIDTAVEILLIVSNLNYQQVKPAILQLHELQIVNQTFEFIKPKYRQILHHLYKYFLNMAIHKYNTAKKQLMSNPDYQGASLLKEQGLNCYRLCWKLLEASLIVRKQGKDLDLGHIETSERKEIEIGINNLLSKYFPNKIN